MSASWAGTRASEQPIVSDPAPAVEGPFVAGCCPMRTAYIARSNRGDHQHATLSGVALPDRCDAVIYVVSLDSGIVGEPNAWGNS